MNIDPLEEQLLEPFLSELRACEGSLLQQFKQMATAGNRQFPLDFYIQGIVNRSLSLIYGFETLLLSNNFKAAAHLVRPHLDNYLRLYAAWLVSNPQEFALEVMHGKKVDEFKCRDKQPLKDWYLRNKASEEFDWIKDVYVETSGFIHFSEKQVFTGMEILDKENGIIEGYISKYDVNVPNTARINAIACMTEITNCILSLIYGYYETKRSTYK